MRAADSDRERILEVVRQAHAEGRLSTPEFYERLDGVYQAKTFADLDEFVVDLPPAGTTLVPSPGTAARPVEALRPDPGRELARMPRELRAVWVTWATVVSINVLIWFIIAVASDEKGPPFWPIWVAGPWGLVLAGVTLTWWLNRKAGPDQPMLPPGRG